MVSSLTLILNQFRAWPASLQENKPLFRPNKARSEWVVATGGSAFQQRQDCMVYLFKLPIAGARRCWAETDANSDHRAMALNSLRAH